MAYSLTPYILLTVHRRYNVLAANLRHIQTMRNTFYEPPNIVVVRGDPERKVDTMFDQWKMDGLIDFVYDRPSIGTGFNISLLEGLNIAQGAMNIKTERLRNHQYGPYFIIVQAGDCFAKPNTYSGIHYVFNNLDIDFFTFYWKNHLNTTGLHTNFFAYNPDRGAAPICFENYNVLEVQFYKELLEKYQDNRSSTNSLLVKPKWIDFNNEGDSWFYHTHHDVEGYQNLMDDLKKNLEISGENQ